MVVAFLIQAAQEKCRAQPIASYISLEPGVTFSWLPGAQNFFFPYVYPYETINNGLPHRMYFNDLGSGTAYTIGLSAEFPLHTTNALRFDEHNGQPGRLGRECIRNGAHG